MNVGASLVAQRLENIPSMPETWVPSLGEEESLEKEMAPHSSTPFHFFHLFLLVGG